RCARSARFRSRTRWRWRRWRQDRRRRSTSSRRSSTSASRRSSSPSGGSSAGSGSGCCRGRGGHAMMTAMGLPPVDALEDLVRRAGELALAKRGRVAAEEKADRTLVTEADREVEAFLVSALATILPEAAVLAEEGSVRSGAGSLCVVIDPIDGTSAFLAGLPTWCVSPGVLEGGRAIAGVVHVPCTGETYGAAAGAARLNGRPMRALPGCPPAAEPYILVPAKLHLRRRLRYPGKARALGSAAHH